MIASLMLALPAVTAIGLATPRQAGELFGDRLPARGQRRLRRVGAVLLAVSFAAALTGDDRARHGIAWTMMVGLIAMAVALALIIRSALLRKRTRFP